MKGYGETVRHITCHIPTLGTPAGEVATKTVLCVASCSHLLVTFETWQLGSHLYTLRREKVKTFIMGIQICLLAVSLHGIPIPLQTSPNSLGKATHCCLGLNQSYETRGPMQQKMD